MLIVYFINGETNLLKSGFCINSRHSGCKVLVKIEVLMYSFLYISSL